MAWGRENKKPSAEITCNVMRLPAATNSGCDMSVGILNLTGDEAKQVQDFVRVLQKARVERQRFLDREADAQKALVERKLTAAAAAGVRDEYAARLREIEAGEGQRFGPRAKDTPLEALGRMTGPVPPTNVDIYGGYSYSDDPDGVREYLTTVISPASIAEAKRMLYANGGTPGTRASYGNEAGLPGYGNQITITDGVETYTCMEGHPLASKFAECSQCGEKPKEEPAPEPIRNRFSGLDLGDN